MMEIMVNFIQGVNVGFEFVQDEDYGYGLLLDLFLFRILFLVPND